MAVSKPGPDPELDLLPIAGPAEITPTPKEHCWLVRGLWGRSAVGVLGGSPKCGKSWLGLDMAVSVSSATACLDSLRVDCPGLALIYLAEDSPAMVRSRIESICAHRDLELASLDLKLITAPALRLDLVHDQSRLTATVDKLQPRLLLLDPLIRLHRLDENSSSEISGLLGFLRELQRSYDLAVILVHHTSKKHRSNPGMALRGSSDIHAFGDSYLYLAKKVDKLTLTIEHRAAACPDPLTLQLVSRPDGSATHLEVVSGANLDEQAPNQPPKLEDQVVALLATAASPRHRSQLRSELKVNNQRLGHALASLEQRGAVLRTEQGWVLTRQSAHQPDPSQLKLLG